jgi:hypothetical protein
VPTQPGAAECEQLGAKHMYICKQSKTEIFMHTALNVAVLPPHHLRA